VEVTLVLTCPESKPVAYPGLKPKWPRGKHAVVDPIRRTTVYSISIGSSMGEIDYETSPYLDETSLSPLQNFHSGVGG
jgi:hypothetical protein